MSDDNLTAEKAKAFQEGWRAHKNLTDAARKGIAQIPSMAPKSATKKSQILGKYDSARLTLQDLKFLYDCGISCE